MVDSAANTFEDRVLLSVFIGLHLVLLPDGRLPGLPNRKDSLQGAQLESRILPGTGDLELTYSAFHGR